MEHDDLVKLSVKELKELLTRYGVDYSDCFEKTDLQVKLQEAIHRATSAPPPSPSSVPSYPSAPSRLNHESRVIAGLSCEVLDNCENPEFVVIFSHGFGANNADLVPIAQQILTKGLVKKRIRFYFPDGTLNLGGNSRAWWMIDIQALVLAAMTGTLRKVSREVPVGLDEAQQSLLGLTAAIIENDHVKIPQIVYAGFSQGAILSTHIALHLDETPAGLCIFSGALLCGDLWESKVASRKGLKVVQSHGTKDQLLPYEMAVWLKELLEQGGLDVDFISFSTGHTIPNEATTAFVKLLNSL